MFESFIIESFNFSYNHRNILTGLYLTAKKSEIIGILGRNGSGKTTLFNALTITGNYSGTIFINKQLIEFNQLKKYIAYLPQVDFLPYEKTVKYIIKMFPISQEKKEMIEINPRISLLLKTKYGCLSGGEKRYIAFLLVNGLNRPIVILDEPFSEIEPMYEESICNEIRKQKDSKLYIISDHKYKIIKNICDTYYLLKNTYLIKINSESELVSNGYLP